jgi:hypothetical protein
VPQSPLRNSYKTFYAGYLILRTDICDLVPSKLTANFPGLDVFCLM